jgi:hypothetical protein
VAFGTSNVNWPARRTEVGHFAGGGRIPQGLLRLATVEGTNWWRARLYRTLGELHERMGKGDEALVYFRRALAHDPNEPVAKAKVAQIDALLGGNPDRQP